MATASNIPPPMPGPDVPLVDVRTGKINRDWYVWLKFWFESFRVVRSEV